MKCSLTGNNEKAIELAKSLGWIKPDGAIKRNFERGEFEVKLSKLGIKIPW